MAAYPDRGLKAPEIRQYIERVRLTANFGSGRPQPTYDEESCKLIDELFSLMGRLKPYYPSGAKALWLVADRGSIEDFGDLDEYLEEEYVENAAEFEELWRAEYPEEKVWMELLAIEEERYGIRSLSLGGGRVYWQQSGVARESYVTVITPLANWLLESVKNRIAELESGTYNAQIDAELPPQHRTGTIIRKDFWDLFPEQREAFFKDLTNEEIEEFAKRVTEQPEQLFARLDAEKVLAKVEAADSGRMKACAPTENADALPVGADALIGPQKELTHKPEVEYEDFEKLEFRVGTVLLCEEVPKSKKLLRFEIDFGGEKRQIVSGIKAWYKAEEMPGKRVMAIVNLKPARLAGLLSEGMLLSAEDEEGNLSLMTTERAVKPGAEVR